MKKKLLSMLLVATMVMGIFTGCGADGSAETITFRDMLTHVLEENDGEIIIYERYNTSGYQKSFTENSGFRGYFYNGKEWARATNGAPKLKEFQANEVDFIQPEERNYHDVYGLVLYKHESGTPVEYMSADACGNSGIFLKFGECSHVEINGISYMLFTTYNYTTRNGLKSTDMILIEDTEYTKNKKIVLDSGDSEDIEVVSRDINWTWWFTSDLSEQDKILYNVEE